jgi:hypothetical protein
VADLPRIFCRKQIGNTVKERDCALSAKGWVCGFCKITVVKPEGSGKCGHCKATVHVIVNGRELERTEKRNVDPASD